MTTLINNILNNSFELIESYQNGDIYSGQHLEIFVSHINNSQLTSISTLKNRKTPLWVILLYWKNKLNRALEIESERDFKTLIQEFKNYEPKIIKYWDRLIDNYTPVIIFQNQNKEIIEEPEKLIIGGKQSINTLIQEAKYELNDSILTVPKTLTFIWSKSKGFQLENSAQQGV